MDQYHSGLQSVQGVATWCGTRIRCYSARATRTLITGCTAEQRKRNGPPPTTEKERNTERRGTVDSMGILCRGFKAIFPGLLRIDSMGATSRAERDTSGSVVPGTTVIVSRTGYGSS